MDLLSWLQEWYHAQCDGDWEHVQGVKIETLDNPGWHVVVDLTGTELEGRQMERIGIERTDENWMFCKVENGCFSGAGGPKNLEEILDIFYRWATNYS